MAFQMIPPRVSSSPPPLDSLPTVTCPGEEEDDEFGDFSTHNSSFDITGLSDKLPPTPDASPSKFPAFGGGSSAKGLSVVVEGMREDTISQDSGVGSANHPNEFSPVQPDGRIFEDFSTGIIDATKTAETKGNTAESNDSSNEFAEFQSCASTEKGPLKQSLKNESTSDKEIDRSLDNGHSSISSQAGDPRNFSLGGTPPPLDHVAETIALDDEFTRYSPNHAPGDNEFGNFTSFGASDTSHQSGVEVQHSETKDTSLAYQSPIAEKTEVEECQAPKGKSANIIDNTKKGENVSEDSDSQTPDDWHSVNSGDSSNDTYSVDKGNADRGSTNVDSEVNVNSNVSDGKDSSSIQGALDKGENCSRTTETDKESDQEKERLSKCAITNFDNITVDFSASLAVQEEKDNTCSITRSNIQVNDKGNVNKEQTNNDSKLLEEDCDFGEFSGPGVVESASNHGLGVDERTGIAEEEKAQSSISDAAGAEDHDFGGFVFHKTDGESDFHKSKGEEEDGDDDDLDFGDIRARVESGIFEESPTTDEWGDFGTFASATDAKASDDNFGDFGDFGTASGEEDDFGDFSAPAAATGIEENMEFEDEFGDFTTTGNADDFGAGQNKQIEEVVEDFSTWKGSNFKEAGEVNPVLKKLENLVLKWIPKHSTPSGSSSSGDTRTIPSLHQVVESDAFVWHHLENLEGSAALKLSWGNTQAHNLFLSSVNVDARNILFGQKWSSSVPLFAQTLSFSPLTPAKSSEGSSGNGIPVALSSSSRGPTTPPATAPTSISLSRHPSEEAPQSEVSSVTDGNPEEQIPPAKFDWTSSGLTNPLEGPGLEREFLSEGGEKSSLGRLKGPPAPSPLVQQILGGGMNTTSSTTPLQSLTPEVRHVVEHLPDLGFMRSRVLMFPIRGEQ